MHDARAMNETHHPEHLHCVVLECPFAEGSTLLQHVLQRAPSAVLHHEARLVLVLVDIEKPRDEGVLEREVDHGLVHKLLQVVQHHLLVAEPLHTPQRPDVGLRGAPPAAEHDVAAEAAADDRGRVRCVDVVRQEVLVPVHKASQQLHGELPLAHETLDFVRDGRALPRAAPGQAVQLLAGGGGGLGEVPGIGVVLCREAFAADDSVNEEAVGVVRRLLHHRLHSRRLPQAPVLQSQAHQLQPEAVVRKDRASPLLYVIEGREQRHLLAHEEPADADAGRAVVPRGAVHDDPAALATAPLQEGLRRGPAAVHHLEEEPVLRVHLFVEHVLRGEGVVEVGVLWQQRRQLPPVDQVQYSGDALGSQ
mmetsp:Transcript_34782/g.99922  ORF Transcript_34782/g.99922 Transcript_34782/m.99922 type:complete len:364 (+) Transcript_34782:2043-3134(+)